MNKEKRSIQSNANKEVKHLMVLLDKSEASEFKKMVPELTGHLAERNKCLEQKLKCVSRFYPIINTERRLRSTGNRFVNKILTLKI